MTILEPKKKLFMTVPEGHCQIKNEKSLMNTYNLTEGIVSAKTTN